MLACPQIAHLGKVMCIGRLLLVTSKVCFHESGNVGLHVCAKFYEHIYTVLYVTICTSPEAGCYWLRVCYVAMTIVILDYMCVPSFMITHITNNNFSCLRLFVVVYKLVVHVLSYI